MSQENSSHKAELLKRKFDLEFHRELGDIIKSRDDNPHVEFLVRELAEDSMNTRKLFQYGMDHLPEISTRPNMKLSTFFLLLSELKDLHSDARSLALDLMIYCENEPDGPDSLRPDLISREYEKILPLLS